MNIDIGGFIRESIRVLNVATRPRQKEFMRIIKVTGLGIILVGLAGVILSLIFNAI
ncbi:Protein translocase subunit SecE [uncultured archaeon]|nr:Protein translocase subunit SecE [uncultured archaeon]